MTHPYPRTEKDLRYLAVQFSSGNITKGIPERLECLAAWHRVVVESAKSINGEANDPKGAEVAFTQARTKLQAAGVDITLEGLSQWCNPDEP